MLIERFGSHTSGRKMTRPTKSMALAFAGCSLMTSACDVAGRKDARRPGGIHPTNAAIRAPAPTRPAEDPASTNGVNESDHSPPLTSLPRPIEIALLNFLSHTSDFEGKAKVMAALSEHDGDGAASVFIDILTKDVNRRSLAARNATLSMSPPTD